jgi:hypothetical protein
LRLNTRNCDHLQIVRGFKTRLNTQNDMYWYQSVGRTENFYQVEPELLLPMLHERSCRLIRLSRRCLVKHAVSWLRAVFLAKQRNNLWNVAQGSEGLGPIPIEPDMLARTMAWLRESRASYDTAFDAYPGNKLRIHYEDVLSDDPSSLDIRAAWIVCRHSLELMPVHFAHSMTNSPAMIFRPRYRITQRSGLGWRVGARPGASYPTAGRRPARPLYHGGTSWISFAG